MARTVNFNFAQGGGATPTSGLVSITPTQMHTTGTTVIVPGPSEGLLVGGLATIANIEPTPTAADGWRYEVRIDADDRRVHLWIVEVPAGTTAIDFSTLPVISSFVLPPGVDGVRIEQWMDSVRSHAAAAAADAANALQGVVDANLRIDGLESGTGGGGTGTGGPGTMIAVNEVNGTYTRPTTNPAIVYVFTGVSDPGTKALENDRWERLS